MWRTSRVGGGSHDGRWPAWAGALVTSILLLGMSAWRGGLDLYGASAALLAIAAFAFWPARPQRTSTTEGPATATNLSDELVARFPDPLILVDRRAVVVVANDAASRILPSLTRRNPLSFALRAPEVLESVARVIATGEQADVVYGGRSATEPIFEVRIRRLPEAGRVEPAAALFFRDLTPQRRLETMRVDFVANVSHELRTPLASLLGFVETLQGPARDDPKARDRFLEIMRDQANRMARLIDDLLQLSRVELHAHVAPDQPLDLGLVVGHMLDVMTPLARERGVRLDFVPPAEPVLVLGDRDEMIRVTENLIENGIKYGGSGGIVEVTLGRVVSDGHAARVELAVRDYGPGIAPEHLPRLTERFYRVDPGQSRSQGGTGLGLAIVKHIVGRHRGRLGIESTPGEGSLVRVTLPEHRPAGAVMEVS
jgi:two-component system phosphate regulon sensor histidine kinase PhoR